MVENSVDPATGMVTIRATMPNKDELLWPGTLVNTELTLRTEERITVPAAALQLSQAGKFVFVVKDDAVAGSPGQGRAHRRRTVGDRIRPRGRRGRGDRRPVAALQRHESDNTQRQG